MRRRKVLRYTIDLEMKSEDSAVSSSGRVKIFLCGDVMTGRGIDQILPSPGDPTLHESFIRDARDYVALAERANGPIPRKAGFEYIWGETLAELDRAAVDVRIINLETSVTASNAYWKDKEIHYRMHPSNIGCLTAAKIDCCCLANNHVLDWGYDGLIETLRTLEATGIAYAGAGRNASEAAKPAILNVPGKGRVLVFGYGSPTAGVAPDWAATGSRPGVNFLADISAASGRRVAAEMQRYRQDGDVVVASIHWGSNWDYHVSDDEIAFARTLIEQGVCIVHGHSSHHVKGLELQHGGLVLYGCGDFINDYEGISGYESFRSELRLMAVVSVEASARRVVETRLIPMHASRFRLEHATEPEGTWLCELLDEFARAHATRVELAADRSLMVRPG